jgi:inward rectifier potassium channel
MSQALPFKIVKKNVPLSKSRDIYHDLLAMSWVKTFLVFVCFFLLINSLFATLYWLSPGSLQNSDNSWASAFFFSVQTLGTIGYGFLAPATTYANILVTIEAFLGLIIIAILTGLFFAKFSRPKGKIEFTNGMTVTTYNGLPTLMFRMVNIRKNQIIDATMSLNILLEEKTLEGQSLRRFTDLKLVRSAVPMFAMSMTLMHVIDQESPMFEMNAKKCTLLRPEIFVTMVGTDGTFGQTIHATHTYQYSDIQWGKSFKDMVTVMPDGSREIDYANFHHML